MADKVSPLLQQFGIKVRNSAAQALEQGVREALPPGLSFGLGRPAQRNPGPESEAEDQEAAEAEVEVLGAQEDGEQDGEQGEDGEDGEDGDDGDEGLGSMVWEDADPAHNLACAVAAFRIGSDDGSIIARNPKTGAAFFGDPEDLTQYIVSHDEQEADWETEEDANVIMTLEYDQDTLVECAQLLDTTEYTSAKDVYDKFNWGQKATVAVVKSITGIHGQLAHLGACRQIDYGSFKGGTWTEYTHECGEKTGVYPQLYALIDPESHHPVALVIQGGNMRVEPRGIVE